MKAGETRSFADAGVIERDRFMRAGEIRSLADSSDIQNRWMRLCVADGVFIDFCPHQRTLGVRLGVNLNHKLAQTFETEGDAVTLGHENGARLVVNLSQELVQAIAERAESVQKHGFCVTGV